MLFSQNQIDQIQDCACDRITELFDILEIDYEEGGVYCHFSCPVHNGDNSRGCFWSFKTNSWKCCTRHCEKNSITGNSSSVFGLVRGILSNRLDKNISFISAVQYICNSLNINTQNIDNDYDQEIVDLVKKQKKNDYNTPNKACGMRLSDIKPLLTKDDKYYPFRGISQNIIDRYHISFCDNRDKAFYNRAFFPILDESGKFVVGFSARIIYDKCQSCGLYHHKNMNCPDRKYQGLFCKWKHSYGFNVEQYLYNYWSAKRHICYHKAAIVCEGPGDIWKLEEAGIKNGVAIMGLNISKQQRRLLQKAGALTLIFILDNDDAGKKAIEKFEKELIHYFRLIFITPNSINDVGDMITKDIMDKIKPIIDIAEKRYVS